MNCPQCKAVLDSGVRFCGNCGYSVAQQEPALAPQIAQAFNQAAAPLAPSALPPQPLYATAPGQAVQLQYAPQAVPGRHNDEVRAILSLVFSILSLPGAIIPIVGIAFAVVGIVLGTLSRKAQHKTLSTVGIVLSIAGLAISLLLIAVVVQRELGAQTANQASQGMGQTVTATTGGIKNDCYKVDLGGTLQVEQKVGTCNVTAYSGTSIDQANYFYKVIGVSSQAVTERNFQQKAKQALEKDLQSNLPEFTITGESSKQFADSTGYAVTAQSSDGVSIIEHMVYHQSANGINLFLVIYADQKSSVNLDTLEKTWEWQQ